MIAAALATRALTEKWRSAAGTLAAVLGITWLAIEIYGSIDLSIYDSLPEPVLALVGFPRGASAQVLAFNEGVGMVGGLAVSGVAIALGADIVAGGEGRRTLQYVLAQPISRLTTVVTSAAVHLTLVAAMSAGIWAGSQLLALGYDVDTGELHLGALCVTLGASAALHGAAAFAVGAITGRKGLAAGAGSALLMLGWLGSGLLPLTSGYAKYADWLPYHWFAGQKTLMRGLDQGTLAQLIIVMAALFAVGIVSFPLRDLRSVATAPLGERLRAVRLHVAPRSVAGAAIGRGFTMILVVSMLLAVSAVMMGPMFDSMKSELGSFQNSLPDDLLAIFGIEDLLSPGGFLWTEVMSVYAPLAIIALAAAQAVGLAKEERAGRVGFLLSTGVSRARVLRGALLAILVGCGLLAMLTFVGLLVADTWGGLGLPVVRLAGACMHLFGYGLCVGAISLAVAAATGSAAAAGWGAAGVGFLGHFTYSLLQLDPATAVLAKLSPTYYYAAARPLESGADWGHVGVLLALASAALTVAFRRFDRRDLRV